MTEHDFKGALSEFDSWCARISKIHDEHLYDKNYNAIEFALRLAEKVTQEPGGLSFNAINIFRECVEIGCDCDSCVSDAFSATIRAIIKEVSGD